MIRLLLDAFPLLAPKSGVGYYTWHLLHALTESYTDQFDYIYFYGRRFSRHIIPRPSSFDTTARATLKRYLPNPYRITQPIKEFVFSRGVSFYKPQLYHQLNYVLLPFNGPQVATVFDLSIARFPELHPRARVNFFNTYFYERLHRATRIIVISEFTKRELCAVADVPEDRVDVTYLAAPPHFTQPTDKTLRTFQKKKQLNRGYILYVGNLEPRKNLVTLLYAYNALRQTAKTPPPPLVLAGEATWLADSIFSTITSLALDNHVIIPGYIPEEELPLWYAGASVFVYPSRYEGFGLPVVEAMALGIPSLVADATSLPEVTGDAAWRIAPDDVDAWCAALHTLLNEPELREKYSRMGRERAALFSWERCARDTVNVYTRCLA